MKVAIVVLAHDAEVRAFFEKLKGAVVPKELRKGGIQYSVISVDALCSNYELLHILLDAHGKHDAVGVLVEAGCEERFFGYSSAIFIKIFNSIEAKKSMQNYFGHNLARWIKNLLYISRSFTDGKQLKCLLLPFKNFASSELAEIMLLCREQNGEGTFPELLEKNLKIIRERSVPKKKKSGKQHFIKDDYERYFELGKEKHGQSETSTPPHVAECSLTSWARFGVTLDRDLHYNVTFEASDISGQFNDCHGSSIQIKACSHINMFPNGFIR